VDLLYTIARLAEKYWKEGHRLRPVEVVQEYEKTIFDELDLMREAANASQLRRSFLNSAALYVPEVYWELTRQNVLVMERISGIPVGDIDALHRQGINMKLLGERGVEIFFTQVFKYNFFHADMHPGNIFVEPSGRYIAVDFGIVGTLNEEDKRYLADNLLAFFNRDYKRVAELHIESGWVPAGTKLEEFESAIRTVSEPIFEKPLSEISFGNFLLRLFQTARRFDMQVQPQLVLLQKTLLNIEGLGRQLYPDLDLWTTAKPFLERWMHEQVGHRAFISKIRKNLPDLVEHLPDLPKKLNKIIDDASSGRLEIKIASRELDTISKQLRRQHRNTVSAVSGGTMLISGALMLVFGSGALISTAMATALGVGLGLGGGFILLKSLFDAS
jgi:ubiquinone biosynthesis protein